MITIVFAAVLAAVEIPVTRVADDAKVIDRVAQASRKDLPTDLLKRIVNEDIESLRGHHPDGTYEYASFERFEAGRQGQSFSVQTSDTKVEMHGSLIYRVLIESPSRRMLVTKNRRVYLERAEIDYIAVDKGATRKIQTVKLDSWLEPGQSKSIDFEAVATEATVRLFGHADDKQGYANLDMTLIEARVIDNADSPYADAVASAKAILRGLDHDDIPSIRAMAKRMQNDLVPQTPGSQVSSVPVVPGNTATGQPAATAQPVENPDVLNELQAIEDLLTGTEAEKRQGMDRLHQLVRKLRPAGH
jgi:hypothetical protein